MTDDVSLDKLRAAAHRVDISQAELVRLVRLADANSIPKATIAATIGKSRETVRRYCKGSQA